MDEGILIKDLTSTSTLSDSEYMITGSSDIKKISIADFISQVKAKLGYGDITQADIDEICVTEGE
ncbi:hypothetical protein [Eubacterium sp. An11]|uniref:hypothetical protein n=1 Tax=Eubacterium sp. An11 TaxID=1965542 RepID=UPI00111E17D4|nr:hypothetical protein [Eubacterium sp. An11]